MNLFITPFDPVAPVGIGDACLIIGAVMGLVILVGHYLRGSL